MFLANFSSGPTSSRHDADIHAGAMLPDIQWWIRRFFRNVGHRRRANNAVISRYRCKHRIQFQTNHEHIEPPLLPEKNRLSPSLHIFDQVSRALLVARSTLPTPTRPVSLGHFLFTHDILADVIVDGHAYTQSTALAKNRRALTIFRNPPSYLHLAIVFRLICIQRTYALCRPYRTEPSQKTTARLGQFSLHFLATRPVHRRLRPDQAALHPKASSCACSALTVCATYLKSSSLVVLRSRVSNNIDPNALALHGRLFMPVAPEASQEQIRNPRPEEKRKICVEVSYVAVGERAWTMREPC